MPKLTKTQIIWISGFLTALSFILKEALGYAPITIAVMLTVTFLAGFSIFKRAISALRYKIIGIDALVTVAVLGAVIIGEYWEAAAVTFLFILGDYLESRTIEKTRSSIRALMDLAPDTARVRRNGEEIILSPDELLQGDEVVVKPGEKIAVDGTVLEGAAYVNQAAITGESIPLHRLTGDEVFSGTILESGWLTVRADKVGEDTTFARILHMVEEAQDKKAKSQAFLERFSRWYTPAIMILSAIVWLITRDVHLALTLLVISCPGALVISTPISIVAGIGNGARHGVLIKGGDVMEKLGTVRAVAFDKTGTLTQGRPSVTHVKAFNGTEDNLLRLAAIGERYSEHPLGRAIINEAEARLGPITEIPGDADIIIGQGIRFVWEDKTYYIGNRALLEEAGISFSQYEDYLRSEEEKGQTAVLMADSSSLMGVISIADQLRPEAKDVVRELKRLGIQHTVMLTGDNQRAARAVGELAGLDDVYAELLPEDKVRVLQEMEEKYGSVAMVGDGVNDAPALASAHLGVAIGGAGTDVAMETADVVLMSADVGKLGYAVGLSRATVNNIRQNIVFALLVVAFLLAGVLFRTVNMSIGMLVHEGSVLLVIINAMRLLGYHTKGMKDKKTKESLTGAREPSL